MMWDLSGGGHSPGPRPGVPFPGTNPPHANHGAAHSAPNMMPSPSHHPGHLQPAPTLAQTGAYVSPYQSPQYLPGQQIQQSNLLSASPGRPPAVIRPSRSEQFSESARPHHHHHRRSSTPSPAADHRHHKRSHSNPPPEHHHKHRERTTSNPQVTERGFFSNLFGLGKGDQHRDQHHHSSGHHHHHHHHQHRHSSSGFLASQPPTPSHHHHGHHRLSNPTPPGRLVALPMGQPHRQPQHVIPVSAPPHHHSQQPVLTHANFNGRVQPVIMHAPPRPRIPPPPMHPEFQYSKCTGKKKALCIGINYFGQGHELKGCINDARHMRDFLIKHYGYRPGDIVLLTDDSRHSRQMPTRKNIIDAMYWLVNGAEKHDSLFFHYSGHGGQTKDLDGDEVDGFDEVIFPVDFQNQGSGHIVDDEMHDIMVKSLPPGCRLTAIFDSCHSGTVLDLPYIYSSSGRLKGSWVSNRARARKASPADVISWSGCKDGQKSADTFKGGIAVGAMSFAFTSSLAGNLNQSYAQLLRSVRAILYPKYDQKPQLGSSHPIDTSKRFIM